MALLIALILSVFLQFFSALYAIILIKTTNWKSLIFLAIVFFSMATIRLLEIIPYFSFQNTLWIQIADGWIQLAISFIIAIGVVIFGSNIHSLKKAEKNRIESENKFKTLFQSTSDEIFLVDINGKFIEANNIVSEVLGYSNDELSKMYLKDICSEQYSDVMETIIDQVKTGETITEAEYKTKDGKTYPVEMKSTLIQYGEQQVILNIARNISERKQTERKILNAIIETEQKERERFARDLHDELGNILSSMNIYFQLIKSSTIDEAERENLLGYFKGLLNEAIASTKEIANNLSPNIITRFGLSSAVQMFCDKINKTGLIKIYLTTSTNEKFSKDFEINIYKIITELINNTLKHALADRIYIALSDENKLFRLKYEDSGIGFDYDKTMKEKNNKGMGLSNITSRVTAIGGTMKIESNKLIGTRINIQTYID